MGGYSEFRALLATLTMARTSSENGASDQSLVSTGAHSHIRRDTAIATGDFTRIRELACQYAAIVARVRDTRWFPAFLSSFLALNFSDLPIFPGMSRSTGIPRIS